MFSFFRYDGNQVNLSHIVYDNIEMARSLDNHRSQGVFFHDYYPNGEWDIIRAPAMRNQKKYSCCLQPYYDITYALVLKRKTLFYRIHLIIPCVGISFLTFIVFYLPSQSGEKIVLCISIELALTVIFPLLADLIPSTSIMMPLLGRYLLFIMIIVALSIVHAIGVLAIYHREEKHGRQMPRWMKKFFIEVLPPVLLLSTQHLQKEEPKTIRKNRWKTLPNDPKLDAIFARLLEKMLHLGEIEHIFSRFDTTATKKQVIQHSFCLAFLLSLSRMHVIGNILLWSSIEFF